MTSNQKYLLFAGVAAAGLGYWWYTNHQAASQQIVSQPPVPVNSLPNVVAPAAGASVVMPVGTDTTPTGQDQTELNALLTWSNLTFNPPLYASMINALTPAQLDSLYNILTTQWETGAPPTLAQTTFWNGLVQQYPFLRWGQNKAKQSACTTFTC